MSAARGRKDASMMISNQPSQKISMTAIQSRGAELIARDGWSRAQLIEYQRDRLCSLLAHAVKASPYYRDALGPKAATGEMPLSELPPLPKATLMDNFDRIVTDRTLRISDLETHLASVDGHLPFHGYRVFATSGTAGLRGLTIYSEEEFAIWVAASLRVFNWAGITPHTRLVAIGSPNPMHITKQLFAVFHSGRQDVPKVSVVTPLDEIVAGLN